MMNEALPVGILRQAGSAQRSDSKPTSKVTHIMHLVKVTSKSMICREAFLTFQTNESGLNRLTDIRTHQIETKGLTMLKPPAAKALQGLPKT